MDQNVEVNALANATRGFDRLFENDIAGARALFNARDDPFHQLGLGVCAFLEAALGMEAHIIEEAHRCLTLAEAGTRKFTKTRMAVENHRFHPGLEWEIINTDTVVLLGLVNALSETYMGYLQCLYALNSAHSKFTRLYKTVFPNGVDSYTPSPPPPPGAISRETSFAGSVSYSSESSVASSTSTLPASPDVPDSKPVKRGFFSRLASSGTSSTPSLNVAHHRPHLHPAKPDGPVDDLIVAGTAFGYGLFNLVFSLLPKRIQSVVGFFGFKHDRKLALKALAVAAARNDTHSVFAGLVLMTYHGGVLLLSGYQANESRIVAEYQELVDRVFDRFPNGALWILNKAKILRMCHNPDAAINVLQDGLKPDRAFSFAQADALLVFELAWTLLSERRYDEAAKMFLRMTELNTWSHATYYYIAAGCHWSLGNMEKAQELFDRIPGFVDKKLGGKELPTEVFLKKKIAFYKAKQKRLGENEAKFVEAITISPSDEMGLFWNTHARISESVALLHIREWYSTAPVPPIVSPHRPPSASPPPTRAPTPALDTPDEFALRALLLGVVHRTIKSYDTSREFLNDACERQENIEISTWIGGIANFELAVLELKEAEAFENAYYSTNGSTTTGSWKQAFKIATANLDKAMSLATSSTDLSSRLDTRVSMLRDEIASKKELIGL
ncbi:Mitochondrial outer membrane protein IML2 [Leucoagaricus sp. SymC.cos]|nr:Mitochondrial outer membrane protein IML2 [Leucoagaricus sp. SymC.cos]